MGGGGGGGNMKGLKKKRRNGLFKYPFTHGGTGTSKCGIGTKSALHVFS